MLIMLVMQKLFYSNFINGEELEPHQRPKNRFTICPICNSALKPHVLIYNYREHDMTCDMGFCVACGWWDLLYTEWGMMDYPEEFTYLHAILKDFQTGEDDFKNCNEVVYELQKKPENLYDLAPRKVELVIGNLLSSCFDCDIEITKQTRDGGKDLVGFDSNFGKFIVEVKRYKKENKIGVSLVRQLIGAMAQNGVEHGMLVTTSSFSDDAYKLAKHFKGNWSLKLKDFGDICKWLKLYNSPLVDYSKLEELLDSRLYSFPLGALKKIMS